MEEKQNDFIKHEPCLAVEIKIILQDTQTTQLIVLD